MMKNITIKLVIVLCGFLVINELKAGNETYRPAPGSYVVVKGTSTLQSWEMKAENPGSEVVFSFDEEGNPESLESVVFRLNKKSLESNTSGLNRKAYEALDADRYPEIVFTGKGNSRLVNSGDNYEVTATGELNISGVTRQVTVNATCTNNDDSRLVCSGSQKLKMSDFNIDPPVMMFGALRAGDEVTVNYTIIYER